ncbi:unnamed protein product [Larinioides sclopetarius]|uniref:Uncharacterized protein n=1 Tax=Larinioides sclopetarius TaxID=280406 RepID=A0AAV2AU93_9ARAC
MSEATAETFQREDKTSPTEEQDIFDVETSKISDSGFDPFSTKFTNSSAEETSSSQLANAISETTFSIPALNSSDESIPPPPFERWCVDTYAKFYMHVYAYFYLFLSIVDCSVTFIQMSKEFIQKSKAIFPWSTFHRSTAAVGNLLFVVFHRAAKFFRGRQNLQQPIRTVLKPPSNDSLHLMSKQVSTFSRNDRVISQTFEQQRPSAVPRSELMRSQKINAEVRSKEPRLLKVGVHSSASDVKKWGFSSVISKYLPAFTQNNRATPQAFKLQRVSAVQRLEIMHPRASNTKAGSSNPASAVHIRRTTHVVEDYYSVGAASFPQSRLTLQQRDGRKGVSERVTKKHRTTTGGNASSSKQCRNTDPQWKERHHRASTSGTRTHDGRKGVFEQATPKHGPKTGEKVSSSKQRQKTHPRQEENRPRASNDSRSHDKKKSTFEKVTPKHGDKPGKKSSSNKQSRNTNGGKKAQGQK